MSAVIAPAEPTDVADVQRLLTESHLPLDGLEDHVATLLVARDGGRIVGSAALEVYADGVLLRSVAVAPERRGQGMGQELAWAAIHLAESRRAPAIYLLTTTAEGFFRGVDSSASRVPRCRRRCGHRWNSRRHVLPAPW